MRNQIVTSLRCIVFAFIMIVLMCPEASAQPQPSDGPSSEADHYGEYSAMIPRRLLPLLHAQEVQDELKLSKSQVSALEAKLEELDKVWFPARLLPDDQMIPIVDRLEIQAVAWLRQNVDSEQIKRISQLEMQAQSVRMLLRNDVRKKLAIKDSQVQKLVKLAQATIDAQAAQRSSSGVLAEDLTRNLESAMRAEQKALETVLTKEQNNQLWILLGEPFNTSSLKRIYPIAPEFHSVSDWINSSPQTLKSLRGKVVLVHFYAFQCHNCHANFEIYKRWHKDLQQKGVVLIGIQTPETTAERDPNSVARAAKEKGLEFPIMVDLESENWKAWGNTMWPTVYVVDKRGYIRHWWQGELNWQGATGDKTIEQVVDLALSEK
ncbi:MAG: redoxin domain-containing protein [Planctomycetaceae bacterium]|nr:redoxin domain-containing protein [Planctomycetaceae bacterium]